MADQIKILKNKIRAFKSSITRLNNFMKENESDLDLLNLKNRYENLKTSYSHFDDFQAELRALEDDDNENDDEYNAIHDSYFEAISKAGKLLKVSDVMDTSSVSSASAAQTSVKRNIKLENIPLPKFSGKYEEWPSFHDTFKSLVDEQQDISNMQKLFYLKNACVDEASAKIEIFAITNENYALAWDLLRKSYDHNRLIATRHLDMLLSLPKVEDPNGTENLAKVVDHAKQHYQILKNRGIEFGEEVVVRIIEVRLPKPIFYRWDQSLDKDKFPTLEEITQFVHDSIARSNTRKTIDSSKSRGKKTSNKNTPENPEVPNKRRRTGKGANVLVSNTNQEKRVMVSHTTSEKRCIVCPKPIHALYKCEEFKKIPVAARWEIIKKLKLCEKCIRKHESGNCSFPNCDIDGCNKPHNRLLHESTNKTM